MYIYNGDVLYMYIRIDCVLIVLVPAYIDLDSVCSVYFDCVRNEYIGWDCDCDCDCNGYICVVIDSPIVVFIYGSHLMIQLRDSDVFVVYCWKQMTGSTVENRW